MLFSLAAMVADSTTLFPQIDQYNVVWTSQSKNSGDSMPCGGGDIGFTWVGQVVGTRIVRYSSWDGAE